MRNKLIVVLLAFLGVAISGCEKDDICAATTPTTPRLIIEFYNNADPSQLKNVTNLELISDLPEIDTIRVTAVSRLEVPLRTVADVTTYRFVLNAASENPAFIYTDELVFNYMRQDVFVSRACGYKTLFELNNDDLPETPDAIVMNGVPNDFSGTWIKDIVIEEYNVENETDVHVKIYF